MNLLELTLFIMPAYLANMIPVLFSGKLPMDFSKKFFDGRRILGDGKTFKGFFAGVILSTLIYIPVAAYLGKYYLPELNFFDKVSLAFLLSVGALFGDALGSFIKRRMHMERSDPSWMMDQLVFIFTALGFAIAAFPVAALHLNGLSLALIIAFTFVMHLLFNQIAYRLKLKTVPW